MFANFLGTGIGTLVLLRVQTETWPPLGWLLIALFAAYWLGFAARLFRGPFQPATAATR